MDVAAFVLACLSLIIASISAAWQFAAWHLDGARIRTRLVHGVLGRGGVAFGEVRRDGRLKDMSTMHDQGWDRGDLLGIQVTNTGRTRAQITRFGMRLRSGGMGAGFSHGLAGSPALPHWIEPGESATWYADLQDAHALVSATRNVVDPRAGGVHMYVETGTGKSVATKQRLKQL